MLTPSLGGSGPTTFGYHPVLMAAAVPGLMTEGLPAYYARVTSPDAAGREARRRQRGRHVALQCAAVAALAAGFGCVWAAHAASSTSQFAPTPSTKGRAVHMVAGYCVLLAAAGQAVAGGCKLKAAGPAPAAGTPAVLGWHGTLGPVVWAIGLHNVVVGVWIWGFGVGLQVRLGDCTAVPRSKAPTRDRCPSAVC
eukprot:SAG22_NODE_861_length_6818_cov_3.155850_3_plen_195_part_00